MEKTRDDVSEEDSNDMEEESPSETEGQSLLKENPESESHETDDDNTEGKKKWYTTLCKRDSMMKMLITILLAIAFFLCNIAYTTIAPFFPREASISCLCGRVVYKLPDKHNNRAVLI